jgi:hypothetical protein
MQVDLKDAAALVDCFEEILQAKNISIPKQSSTNADMLPLWKILKQLRGGFSCMPDDMRTEYSAAVAVHDLAAKVMKIRKHAKFETLIPHLKMLASGAVHLTQEPPPPPASDVYNKLIEAYWACLLMANDVDVDIDHPKHSIGNNPDVIALENGSPVRAYAFKTVRSEHTQSLLEHLEKGVEQIEQSDAQEGIVVFHLTPRILRAKPTLWPKDFIYDNWECAAGVAVKLLNNMISQVLEDNGKLKIDAIFEGKKAVGAVLCFAFFPIMATNPCTGNPVVMPLKVSALVEMAPTQPLSKGLHSEIENAINMMQTLV